MSKELEPASADNGAVVPLRYGGGMVAETHPDADPYRALQHELRRASYNVRALEQRLADLTGNELVWGPVSSEQKLSLSGGDSYETETSAAQVNLLVRIYVEERKAQTRVAKMLLDYGLDTRQLITSERTVEVFYNAMETSLRQSGLTAEQAERLRTGTAAELRRAITRTYV